MISIKKNKMARILTSVLAAAALLLSGLAGSAQTLSIDASSEIGPIKNMNSVGGIPWGGISADSLNGRVVESI